MAPSWPDRLARVVAALALSAAAAAAACGPGTARPPSPPPPSLPAGYTAYDGGELGFRFGLAPGWQRVGEAAPDGVSFADPSGQGTLLVHVEQARSADLDAATGVVMFELTDGGGVPHASMADSRLAGRPASRVEGDFTAAGPTQRIEAIVMLEGGRAWVLALAGPAASLAADEAAFDAMRASFQLRSAPVLPPAPAEVAMDRPAPGFAELDRIKGPVVLNFFASWCGPCREEMPLLAQRAKAAGGRFTVLGMDTQDDTSKVPDFLKGLGVGFPTGYDRDGHLYQAYLLPGVPGTFFLDAHHVVRDLVYGPLTADTLQRGLKAAGAA
jgi:cytochrome c biogenesis protein CcmG, thiol:disulfide interchange protein DsbE